VGVPDNVTLQLRPAVSVAVQFPVTPVRLGAAEVAGAGSGRAAVCVGAGVVGGAITGSGVFGAVTFGVAGLGGVGSIGTLEPAGGKPGAGGAVGDATGGKDDPDVGGGKGCDVTGGNVEVETRPVGAAVKLC
jgi:hypothetical protein